MATCGSFHHLFGNPKPEKPTLLESLSSSSPWNHKPSSEDETPSFTEIFGELHFREKSTPVCLGNNGNTTPPYASTSSLHLCTEGLGSESSYDVEDVNDNVNMNVNVKVNGEEVEGKAEAERLRRRRKEEYPPAMKRMSLKAYREEGRFVLEEVRIPRREILHASRQDGRLRMKLIHPCDEDEDAIEEDGDGCF